METNLKKVVLLVLAGLAISACAKPPGNSEELNSGILGGQVATGSEEFASEVVIVYDRVKKGLCTGSLLGGNIVLTAAHCVHNADPSDLIVVFATSVSSRNRVIRQVVNSKENENYSRAAIDRADIALVEFEGSMPDGYRAAQLIDSSNQLFAGQTAVLAGYGITAKQAQDSGTLRSVSVKIANPRYGDTEVSFDQTSGAGACHGDSVVLPMCASMANCDFLALLHVAPMIQGIHAKLPEYIQTQLSSLHGSHERSLSFERHQQQRQVQLRFASL